MPVNRKLLLLLILFLFVSEYSFAQLRQIHDESADPENEIVNTSFYTPSEGFVAFKKWIGYTTDSGRTFTKKYIRIDNVDFSGYSVNLTFGFGISSIKAFDKNNIVISGDYGFVPAILTTSDGGDSYKIRFHSQYDPWKVTGGITDMIFPEESTGYAVDADRVLKTTDNGLHWIPVFVRAGSYFSHVVAPDDQHIFTFSKEYGLAHMFRSVNGGSSWGAVILPEVPEKKLLYSWFLTPDLGWLSMGDNNNNYYFYNTPDGGNTWNQLTDLDANPFGSAKFRFVNDSTGYALAGLFSVFKTTDGGAVWEPLPRDNNFRYLNYSHNDIFCLSPNQIWAGGGGGLLELTRNGGGSGIPKAYFKADTTGSATNGNVQLLSYSKKQHQHRWFVNGRELGTSYNATYIHNENLAEDTITLIVSDGTRSDTLIRHYRFNTPLEILSFEPRSAASGDIVTITGKEFYDIRSVVFGGIPATEFSVLSSTTLQARVGAGASGKLQVYSTIRTGSLPGFIYIPPPSVAGFSPKKASSGTMVTITGNNFSDVLSVEFGGIQATSFTVISSTTIMAIVPSGPSGAVVVKTTGGRSELNGFVSYPRINSFTPTQGTHGTVMTITGTSLTDIDKVTIGRVPVESFVIDSHDKITAIVGAGKTGEVVTFKLTDSAMKPGFKWFAAPVITGFSPASGPVGTTVTITGKNFDAVAGKNIVFFGDVKAQVSAGNTTSLTVQVPAGAGYAPVSVLSNLLYTHSGKPFLLTFTGGGSIAPASFADTSLWLTGNHHNNTHLTSSDLDGDGKTDLVLGQYNRDGIPFSGVRIYRNISSGGGISLDLPVTLFTGWSKIELVDLDNDGNKDLFIMGDDAVSIFRNISVPGALNFGPEIKLNFASQRIGIADADGDGKSDLLFSGGFYGDLLVMRNISEPGSIVFSDWVKVFENGPATFVTTDIDNDGKADIIADGRAFRNTSSIGHVSFQPASAWDAGNSSIQHVSDLDGDGLPDIVSMNLANSFLKVFKNTSTGGQLLFDDPVIYDCPEVPRQLAVSDVDGDGKPDISVVGYHSSMGILKNVSSPGNLSFTSIVDYIPGVYTGDRGVVIADLNNDGRNDVVTMHELIDGLYIHPNKVKPEPVVVSFTPTIGVQGTTVTITGTNFNNISAVKFGGADAFSYTVNSATKITAIVAAGNSGAVQVVNNSGAGTLDGFNYGIPPMITDISADTGSVGSVLTILGNNFGPTINDNTVYFGLIHAEVLSASANRLEVKVPAAPANTRISVTVNGLVAFAPVYFSVSFPGAESIITTTSFEPRIERGESGSGILVDLDGDAKPDMLTKSGNTKLFIGRNMSEPGTISFSENISIETGDAIDARGLAAGDIDGDGKPDLVVTQNHGSTLRVFRNLSIAGSFQLTEACKMVFGSYYGGPPPVIIDIDLDGRSDIVTMSRDNHMVSVFRNESGPQGISFSRRFGFSVGNYPGDLVVADLNKDGKPELIVAAGGVNILKNLSQPGGIRFSTPEVINGSNTVSYLDISDFDGDQNPDIVIAGSSLVSVFKNVSVGSNIQFESALSYPADDGVSDIEIGDLDGDGFRDILTQHYSAYSNIYKNSGIGGGLSFLPKSTLLQKNGSSYSVIEDVDVDGLPDIVVLGSYYWTSIFRNRTGQSTAVRYCNEGDISMDATISGTSYQWQVNNNGTFENLVEGTTHSGVNTGTLILHNIPASGNGGLYRCVVDGQGDKIFRLDSIGTMKLPSVTIQVSDTAICAGTQVFFSSHYSNAGTDTKLEWLVNGTATGVLTPEFATSGLSDSSNVMLRLTTSGICLVQDTVYSGVKKISVTSLKEPTVSVIPPAAQLCTNTRTDFNASYTHGGTSPMFTWLKNGREMGPFEPTYTEFNAEDGDVIIVRMRSNERCVTTDTVTSLPLVLTVTETVHPVISINASSTSLVLGQSARLVADIANGGSTPVFEWQDSTTLHGWQSIPGANANTFTYMPETNGVRVRVRMTSAAICPAPVKVTSNAIVFDVKDPGKRVQVTPNPVEGTLYLVVALEDHWEKLEILDMQGKQQMAGINVVNQAKISVPVMNLKPGIYLAVLRNSAGDQQQVRFLKQ